MRLKKPQTAITIDPIGIYWATIKESAASYDATEADGQEVVYEARTPQQGVDWEGTLTAQLEISAYSEEEQEIRFLEGTKIFVIGVHMPDGSFIKVEDWRTC